MPSSSLAGLHRRIAHAAGLSEVEVRCDACGHVDVADGAHALRFGWPEHCGVTMVLGPSCEVAAYGGPEQHRCAFTENVDGQPTDWRLVPPRYRGGLDRWITEGIVPGQFLQALLRNDLMEAALRADDADGLPGWQIRPIILFLQNNAPHDCYGSLAVCASWAAAGGLEGQKRAKGERW